MMQEVVGEVLLDDVALVAAANDEVHPAGTGNDLPPSPMLVIHFFNGRGADSRFGWESDDHLTRKNRGSGLLPNLRFQRVAVTRATGFLGGRVVRQLKEANAKSLRSTTDVEPARVIPEIAMWK